MSYEIKIKVDSREAANKIKKFGKDAGASFTKVKKKTDEAAGATNRFRQAQSGLIRELGALRNKLLVFGFAIGGIVTAFKVFGVSVKLAASLVEAQSRVNVVFGKSAKIIEKFSETSEEALGASTRQVFMMTGEIGNLLTSMGATKEQAAQMSVSTVKMAADLASFNDLAGGTTQALDAIRSALVGQTEPMRRLGSNVLKLRLQHIALAEGISDGIEPLTALQTALTALTAITRDTDAAIDDFSETLGISLPNQLRVAEAQTEQLKIAFGKNLLPATIAFTKRWNLMLKAINNLDASALILTFAQIKLAAQDPFAALNLIRRELEAINRAGKERIFEGPANREGRSQFRKFQLEQKEAAEKAAVRAKEVSEQGILLEKLTREEFLKTQTFKELLFEQSIELRKKATAEEFKISEALEERAKELFSLSIGVTMEKSRSIALQERELELAGLINMEMEEIKFHVTDINDGLTEPPKLINDATKQMEALNQIAGRFNQSLIRAVLNGQNLKQSLKSAAISFALSFLPGGSFLSRVGSFAHGTSFAPGGPALVGERGPEIVNLPRGSQVIPNSEINNISNTSTVNIVLPNVTSVDKFTLINEIMPLINEIVDDGGQLTASRVK